MTETVNETPAPLQNFVCEKINCAKDYKNRSSMLNHMKSKHKVSEEVESPLGNFPSSNSARVLFDDSDQPSTQGNSRGEINYPKVLSITSYQCGACDKHFNTNEVAKSHMSEVHTNKSTPKIPDTSSNPELTATPASKPRQLYSPATEQDLHDNEEAMEEASDEQDLYDALDFITQNVIDPDTEKETRDNIKIKLDRYKSIMVKKNELIKETMEKIKRLEHDSSLSAQVVERQKGELDEKNSEKAVIKGQLKKEEKEHEKLKNQYKSSIETLQETVNNVTKINNDLKTEVATQKKLIINLEGGEPEPEHIEANVDAIVEGQRDIVDMSKENTTPTCNACNKVFKAAGDLDKHMNDRHTESECHMCNKTFTNRKDVANPICLDAEIVPQKCEKTYCGKEFVSSTSLKNHMKSSHYGNQRKVCTECGEILNTNINMKEQRKPIKIISMVNESNHNKVKYQRYSDHKYVMSGNMFSKQSSTIILFCTNAAGLVTGKIDSLKSEINATKANIITIQETHSVRKGKIVMPEAL